MIVKIVKIYLGLSLVVLWAVWGVGSVHFQKVPWSGFYISQDL